VEGGRGPVALILPEGVARTALLDVASDPDVRGRLDAISAELHRDGGPDHAADAVEAVAAGTW